MKIKQKKEEKKKQPVVFMGGNVQKRKRIIRTPKICKHT